MKVADVMTRRLRTCEPRHSVDAVMRILWEHDLGALPVVNDLGQPIAMITDRDIAVAAYTQGKPLHQIPVSSTMSKQLVTVHVSDSLTKAERVMREHQLRRLPVVDESTRLVGMLALSDIALKQASTSISANGPRTDVAQTLAAIARPRTGAIDAEPAAEERPTLPFVASRPPSHVRELANPAQKVARAGSSLR
jgi:CBS domain-containing protein